MNVQSRINVGNLSKPTTQKELKTYFAQAGNVTAAEVINDRKSGQPRGFAVIKVSVPNEADTTISLAKHNRPDA